MNTLPKIERIDCNSMAFPYLLRGVKPAVKQLYCCGNIELLQKESIAVVGSRKYSVYGRGVAKMIGEMLANGGVPVVSGLAKGIDTFAHEGTLNAYGEAIAVLGTGIRHMYPVSNIEIMHKVAETGIVISEYEPDFKGAKGTFPLRNRIIAGLSKAVIVVEGGINSGALITAQYANEQGKNVYAVPGNINSQFSAGTNLLIRDGAIPLVIIDDIFSETGSKPDRMEKEEAELDYDEKKIYDVINRNNGIYVDEISRTLGIKAASVSAVVTILEMKGIVTSLSGKFFSCKNMQAGL